MKRKLTKIRCCLIVVLLMSLPLGVVAQQQTKKDKKEIPEQKVNIRASDFLIPKRKGAEKFDSKKETEHLFITIGSGVGRLLDMGSGFTVQGSKSLIYLGYWITPVIGVRGGLDHTLWLGSNDINMTGVSVDYLINVSTFASRYNSKRFFELIALGGASYQSTMRRFMRPIHSYGLHGGLQGKMKISSAVNLFIEPQLAIYPDRVDNCFSWRRYDVVASVMLGVNCRFSKTNRALLLRNGFSSIAAGVGNTGNVLVNTEFALGKWFGKDNLNAIRISAGSSTAFLDNDLDGAKRDFNVNLCVDYLYNLTKLFANRKDRIFNVLFVGGIGSYFPGSEAHSSIVLNGRLGFQGQIRLSEHMDIWVEPRVNLFKDKSYRSDMQKPIRGALGTMIGTSYRF